MSTHESSEQSSAEILNTLNKKFFGSLVEGKGTVYGSGELGSIPDIFPMLLFAVRDYLSRIDPQGRKPEIEPGLGVTLEQLAQGFSGISPAAFMLFTNRLRHGSYMVGTFSPVKSINWHEARNLINWIAEEVDEVLDDVESTLDPITWRDYKYDIITEMINERAQLINRALRSPSLQGSRMEKTLKYNIEHMMLTNLDIDYASIPLNPIIGDCTDFWARSEGQSDEFLNIIKAVLNASIEPIRQLNRDSLTGEMRKKIQAYVRILEQFPEEIEISKIKELIQELQVSEDTDNNIRNLSNRYFGILAITKIVTYYCEELRQLPELPPGSKFLQDFQDYAIKTLTRRYCLGIMNDSNYVPVLFKTLLEVFREYQTQLSTIDKQAFNSAIIRFDQDIDTYIETAGKLKVPNDPLKYQRFVSYWFEDFSGIIPEEITLFLNIGVLNIFCDHKRKKLFSIFLLENPEGDQVFDTVGVRDLANKAIENNSIPEKKKITMT